MLILSKEIIFYQDIKRCSSVTLRTGKENMYSLVYIKILTDEMRFTTFK